MQSNEEDRKNNNNNKRKIYYHHQIKSQKLYIENAPFVFLLFKCINDFFLECTKKKKKNNTLL